MLARLGSIATALLVAGCSVVGGKAADEPDYRLVAAEEAFEIREYPALTIAVTESDGSWDDAVERGFGRLFRYISGANQGSAEIAMTAPVLTEQAGTKGEKIAMTAPVLTEEGNGGWRTAFVLPAGFTAETAPAPTDPAVRIETISARQVGVVTFSGGMDEEKFAQQRALLEDWLGRQGRAPGDEWQMAGYNPPWTLPWLRRNEVLVTLQ